MNTSCFDPPAIRARRWCTAASEPPTARAAGDLRSAMPVAVVRAKPIRRTTAADQRTGALNSAVSARPASHPPRTASLPPPRARPRRWTGQVRIGRLTRASATGADRGVPPSDGSSGRRSAGHGQLTWPPRVRSPDAWNQKCAIDQLMRDIRAIRRLPAGPSSASTLTHVIRTARCRRSLAQCRRFEPLGHGGTPPAGVPEVGHDAAKVCSSHSTTCRATTRAGYHPSGYGGEPTGTVVAAGFGSDDARRAPTAVARAATTGRRPACRARLRVAWEKARRLDYSEVSDRTKASRSIAPAAAITSRGESGPGARPDAALPAAGSHRLPGGRYPLP